MVSEPRRNTRNNLAFCAVWACAIALCFAFWVGFALGLEWLVNHS